MNQPSDSLYLNIENAAHAGAFGINSRPIPTEAQMISGNYKLGRINLHGFNIAIEQPRNSVRTGINKKTGKKWATRLAAHYGYLTGTKGNDGDGVDVFIGPYPQSEDIYVINQFVNGAFDEHKAVFAVPDAAFARGVYLDSYERGWNGLESMIRVSPSQLKWWLKYGDKRRPMVAENLPYEGIENMMNPVAWDNVANPVGTLIEQVLYGIRENDSRDMLIFDSVTMTDIMEEADSIFVFDALTSPLSKLARKMEMMKGVMETVGESVKPLTVQLSEPFKAKGVAQVAALFELSDGQTVTVYFHNPDVSPSKIAPTDELISWKWLLNKKDITIVAAPERGVDLNVRDVARRVMKLAEKNSALFQKNNAKRAERMGAIQGLKDEITGLESTLKRLSGEIEVEKFKKEERENGTAPTPREAPFMVVTNGKSKIWSADGNTMLGDDFVGVVVDGSDTKKYWYLGRDGGERSFTVLKATNYQDALKESEAIAAKEAGGTKLDPTTPEGYAKVIANPALQLKYQDTLDAMFQERIVAVRNALKGLGWEGGNGAPQLSKKGPTDIRVSFDFTKVGAGNNVVGMSVSVSNHETGETTDIRDDLTKTPEQFAEAIDAAVSPKQEETRIGASKAEAAWNESIKQSDADGKTGSEKLTHAFWRAAQAMMGQSLGNDVSGIINGVLNNEPVFGLPNDWTFSGGMEYMGKVADRLAASYEKPGAVEQALKLTKTTKADDAYTMRAVASTAMEKEARSPSANGLIKLAEQFYINVSESPVARFANARTAFQQALRAKFDEFSAQAEQEAKAVVDAEEEAEQSAYTPFDASSIKMPTPIQMGVKDQHRIASFVLTGGWTNGHILDIGGTPKAFAVAIAKYRNEAEEGRIDDAAINRIVDGAKADSNTFVKPTANYERGDKDYVILANEQVGVAVPIEAKYFAYFYKTYKGAEFLSGGDNRPILVKRNGKSVGVIMPIRGKSEKLLTRALNAKPAAEMVTEAKPPVDVPATQVQKIDAAYTFASASYAFKEWLAESVEGSAFPDQKYQLDQPYSPLASAAAMEEAAKRNGATIVWDLYGVETMDSVSLDASKAKQPGFMAFPIDSALGKFTIFISMADGATAQDAVNDAGEVARKEFGGGSARVSGKGKNVMDVPTEAWQAKNAKHAWIIKSKDYALDSYASSGQNYADVVGIFQEKTHKQWFEFKKATPGSWGAENGYAYEIFVGPKADETRFANIKKTVAEIAVDEDGEGNPVTEKWMINKLRMYKAAYDSANTVTIQGIKKPVLQTKQHGNGGYPIFEEGDLVYPLNREDRRSDRGGVLTVSKQFGAKVTFGEIHETYNATDLALIQHAKDRYEDDFADYLYDSANTAYDGDDEFDFDEDQEWNSIPEFDNCDEDGVSLDGDFKGHPFRGNQYRTASRESGTAVGASIKAKKAEKHGSKSDKKKAHKAAYHAHSAAAETVGSKGARKYHLKMARLHAKHAGMKKKTLDAAYEDDFMGDEDAELLGFEGDDDNEENPVVDEDQESLFDSAKVRLTKEQKEALKAYNYALAQEDRYLGSVFVTPSGQRDIEAKTKAAYDRCKKLGMTHEHGL